MRVDQAMAVTAAAANTTSSLNKSLMETALAFEKQVQAAEDTLVR
jgi:hypothetical protein